MCFSFFLILGKYTVFLSLSMMLNRVCVSDAFHQLKNSSMTSLLSIFILKGCWVLSNIFSASTKINPSVLFFFFKTILLCSSGWLCTHWVAQSCLCLLRVGIIVTGHHVWLSFNINMVYDTDFSHFNFFYFPFTLPSLYLPVFIWLFPSESMLLFFWWGY